MCRAGLESLPSSNAHIGDPWPASAGATGREAAGLPKGSWVSGVAALGPLLLPIGAWGPGVTPLPKVDFALRVRQSPPVTSREHPDMSGPVAARSRPPRRPRSQIFPQSAQSASKLQCPPHDSLENAVFQKRFGFVWQIPYWNGFGIPRNEFRAAHIAVRKSCAGGLDREQR